LSREGVIVCLFEINSPDRMGWAGQQDKKHHFCQEYQMSIGSITARDLYQKVEQGETVQVIDVRTPIEFRELHATVARNCPLDSVSPKTLLGSDTPSAEQPVYVMCRSGNRSRMACEKLEKLGLHVINVEGGTNAWADAGLPVIRGKKAISLERQVRICAGSLILIGSILAAVMGNPWFLALPIFVGGGLAFSGVVDSCAMGMLLAKMPWNQVPKSACDAAGTSAKGGDPSSNSATCTN
jgi:rhodanese-related sulfurtransferase